MSVISSLVVLLTAKTSVFNRNIGGSTKSLRGLTGQIAKTQKAMMAYAKAAAAIYAVRRIVKVQADFQKQLANVSTMLDEQSMKIMPRYTKQLKMLSVQFGESTETLSKGLYDILSASVAPEKAMFVLAKSVMAAKGGMTSTAVAADAITTILNSYGMEAKRAGEVSDKLFAIVKKGKLTFEELAGGIGKVAALANVSGTSFDELGAAIATLTRAGLPADIAMTSIRSILVQFIKPQKDAIAAAKEFGLELNSTTLKTIGLTGVLLKLRNALPEQLAVILPNVRGLAGLASALTQVDEAVLSHEFVLNSVGLSRSTFLKMTGNMSHDLDRLGQSTKLLVAVFGKMFGPIIKSVTNDMVRAAIAVDKITGANNKLSETLWFQIDLWNGLKFAFNEVVYIFQTGIAKILRAEANLLKGLDKIEKALPGKGLRDKLGIGGKFGLRAKELTAFANAADKAADATDRMMGKIITGRPELENASSVLDEIMNPDGTMAGGVGIVDILDEVEDKVKRLEPVAQGMGRAFESAFDKIIEGAAKADGIIIALGRDIVSVLTRQLITAPLASAIGVGLTGMFAPKPPVIPAGMGGGGVPVMHKGGVVGGGAFLNAPRFHNGLKGDEMPAILQKGETVLPKGFGGGGVPNVVVNISNETGGRMEASQSDVKIDPEKLVVDIVVKDFHQNGPIRNLLGNNNN